MLQNEACCHYGISVRHSVMTSEMAVGELALIPWAIIYIYGLGKLGAILKNW